MTTRFFLAGSKNKVFAKSQLGGQFGEGSIFDEGGPKSAQFAFCGFRLITIDDFRDHRIQYSVAQKFKSLVVG